MNCLQFNHEFLYFVESMICRSIARGIENFYSILCVTYIFTVKPTEPLAQDCVGNRIMIIENNQIWNSE